MHFRKARERNEPFPVALIFGMDAEIYLSAVTKLPFGQEEFALAGSLKGEPIELVKCKTIDVEGAGLGEHRPRGCRRTPLRRGMGRAMGPSS